MSKRLLPYCVVSGSMTLGYGSIYTLLADLRDRFGFTATQLGLIVAAGFVLGPLFAAVTAEMFGLRAPFWLLAAVLAAVCVLTLRLDLVGGPVATEPGAIRKLIAVPAMQATLAVAVAFYVTVGMFEAI